MDNIYKDYCTLCKSRENLMNGYYSKTPPRKKDGVVTFYKICNACNNKRLIEYRKTGRGKDRTTAARNSYRNRYKEKQLARWRVQYAVRSGNITKPLHCNHCGLQKPLEGHHTDYKKVLDVLWLCRQCHRKVHSKYKN